LQLIQFIYEQMFTKYANMFFLITGIIQTIGTISPTSKYGTLLPLGAILLFTLFKELVEDAKRHAQDQRVHECYKGQQVAIISSP
jgi:phospholipid-transporting ATPase